MVDGTENKIGMVRHSNVGVSRGESPNDLGDDESVLNALGIPAEDDINNGSLNVVQNWLSTIQPFQHQLDSKVHY
ncbi:colicin E3-like toxin immunity protein [Pseudomonas sp. TSPC2-1]|uniref:colicin E3-like toxin immunity protein n=2 Tax=unclassified Pseudomonas TaxID=196821 RepID=UPI003CE8E8EF